MCMSYNQYFIVNTPIINSKQTTNSSGSGREGGAVVTNDISITNIKNLTMTP